MLLIVAYDINTSDEDGKNDLTKYQKYVKNMVNEYKIHYLNAILIIRNV